MPAKNVPAASTLPRTGQRGQMRDATKPVVGDQFVDSDDEGEVLTVMRVRNQNVFVSTDKDAEPWNIHYVTQKSAIVPRCLCSGRVRPPAIDTTPFAYS